jgi:uncharacterized protein (DUF169 family)
LSTTDFVSNLAKIYHARMYIGMSGEMEHAAEMYNELERDMRLRTIPVDLKCFSNKKEIEGIRDGKLAANIPCYGKHWFDGAQEEETSFAIALL